VVLLAVLGALVWVVVAGGTQPYETYENAVAADGPVAQFRFDDAVASSTLADSAGSYAAANSGIVLGGEGPFGGSKSGAFGGAAYASLPSSPLASATAFSAEGWVDWTGGTSYEQPVFGFGSSATNYMYLTPAGGSKHLMLFEIRTGASTDVQVTAPKLVAKAWKYVMVTETSAGTLTLYVNGEQVGQTTGATIFPSSLGSTASDYLGKSLISTAPLFNGSMSNVAFYTKALSASQVEAHYDAGEYPVNTVLPTITGTAKDGSTLTASKGTWTGMTPITYAYQWTRCNTAGEACTSIQSATGTKYTLGHEDVGSTLRIAVTGSNNEGSSTASSAQTVKVESLAPSNMTLPAISGEAKVGQLLSVSNGTWKGTPPISYGYQWETCNSSGTSCKTIAGVTASSYRVLSSQVGGTLRAVVTASNSAGSAKATSAATAVITTGPPVNTVLPVISGRAEDGQTLSASTGSWAGTEPFSYTYQWELCSGAGESCANISGATSSSYALGRSDVGDTLRIVVTAKNSVGSSSATSTQSAVVTALAPSNTSPPAISGTAQDGQTLTASTGMWSGTPPLTYAYQWQSCNSAGESCTNISGATGSTYVLGHGDVGTTLRVVVTATNSAGSASSTSAASAVVAVLAPSNTVAPTISGTAQDGQTLTASVGSWSGTPPLSYAYQWQSCNSAGEGCTNISGATGSTYVLGHGDVGKTIRVAVTATNSAGSASSTSEATGVAAVLAPSNTAAPAISGTAQDGQTLSASTGSWNGTPPLSYAYQWQSCNSLGESCLNISGATSATYVLGDRDLEATLRVTVIATNSGGSASATSIATATISPLPPANTAAPTVSGLTQEGQTLMAATGTWTGAPAPSFTYQWEDCNSTGQECQAVEGATHQTYTLSAQDQEATVRVTVTATNVGGQARVPSAATTSVTPGAPTELERPSVTGIARQGEQLSGNPGSWGGTESQLGYQWERCDTAGQNCASITGATESAYAVGAADLGETLRLRVGASNATGALTEVSTPSGVVEGAAALQNTSAPIISGTARVGSTLTTTAGSWLGTGAIAYSYQWQRCDLFGAACAPIAGATAATYVPENQSIGQTLRVVVTAAELGGTVAQVSQPTQSVAAEAAPVIQEPPAVSGTTLVGYTLQATPGAFTGEALTRSYQWERCDQAGQACTPISGTTSNSYSVTANDTNGTIRARVTATDAAAHATAAVSEPATISPAALKDVTQPVISGVDHEGQILNVTPGIWTGNGEITFSEQWQRCSGTECQDIGGATATSYSTQPADIAHTLRAVVTASDGSETLPATSSPTATIEGEPSAPLELFAPAIEGGATAGQTLTATPGGWAGSASITYAYQWQRCSEPGASCVNIEGATGTSYQLAETDIGTVVQVAVTASNGAGSATALSPPSELVDTPGPPSNTEAPIINGVDKEDQALSAASGTWSGSRPFTYGYRWERCEASGESCTEIEGATNASYVLASADVGHTLRVKVTAKNNLGGAAVISNQTSLVVSAAEASTSQAIEAVQAATPSLLAPATSATEEEQTIKPATSDSGEQLTSATTLVSSAAGKETPGELSVETPDGNISLTPTEPASGASKLPTVVNGTAAVYAESEASTTTVIRPDAIGATALLQLRAPAAPKTFTWEVDLGPHQQLQQLSNGSVAIVELPPETNLEVNLGEGLGTESPGEVTPSGEVGAEGQEKEESSGSPLIEPLPAAPTASTPVIEPRSGEPHPQETQAVYNADKTALAATEGHVEGKTLAVIAPPTAMDANGTSVATALAAEGNMIRLTVSPGTGTSYPVTTVAHVASSGTRALSKATEYGLSDERPSSFEHSEENGQPVNHFDARLTRGGNRTAPLHVRSGRLVLYWRTPPTSSALKQWLAAVGAAKLEPFITLSDCLQGNIARMVCSGGEPGPGTPSSVAKALAAYRNAFTQIFNEVRKLHQAEPATFPAVTSWGAWNEPNFEGAIASSHGARVAAELWQVAQSVVSRAGCSGCHVAAGEFSGYNAEYISTYANTLLHDHRYWHGKPSYWGLHDYGDVTTAYQHQRNPNARLFLTRLPWGRLGQPHEWISEAGGLLADGKHKTSIYHTGCKVFVTGGTGLRGACANQKLAAEDFLTLGGVAGAHGARNFERAYYYEYEAPGPEKFDSALLEHEKKEPESWRPAYCVLAFRSHRCPAAAETKPPVPGAVTASADTLQLAVDPREGPATYWLVYGTSSAYGQETGHTDVASPEGAQSEIVAVNGLSPCTTYHYQAEAENEANEGVPSLGGDKTFTTPCSTGIFVSNGGGLWTVNGDGTNPQLVRNIKEGESRFAPEPSLSPDGHSLAFNVNHYPNPSEIRVEPVSGGGPTMVFTYPAREISIEQPRWSPNGTQLIFGVHNFKSGGGCTVERVNADGTNLTTIATSASSPAQPSYSADGSKIVYIGSTNGQCGGPEALDVANADGSGLVNILPATDLERIEQPRFSPNGAKLTFSGERESPDEHFNWRIYTVNLDGTALTELTHSEEANSEWDFAPEWTPDGTQIVYNYQHGRVTYELYIVNADGSNAGHPWLGTLPGVSEDWAISFSP
jgi:hypothetical protein